jgi:hypothetical protein
LPEAGAASVDAAAGAVPASAAGVGWAAASLLEGGDAVLFASELFCAWPAKLQAISPATINKLSFDFM